MDQNKFNAVTIKLLEDIIDKIKQLETDCEYIYESDELGEMRAKLDKLKELYQP